MATQVQFRRGTTTQNNAFTGAIGEITLDTEVKTFRVHDGSTPGGGSILINNTSAQTLTNKTLSTNSVWNGQTISLGFGGTGSALTAVPGAIAYSTNNSIGFTAAGSSGQLLVSSGTGVPAWVSASAITAGTASTAVTATNIAGGSAGYLPYQLDTGTTSFIAPGSAGTFLQSTGSSTAPSWAAGQVTFGSTTVALGGTSTSISGLTAINATAGATSFFATPTAPVLFAAATSLTLGNATAATLTVNPGTVVGANTTQNVYNTVATTVNAYGAATTVTLGATTGTLSLRNATVSLPNATAITTGQTTVALLNTTATTVNAFGAATVLSLGSATGNTTVNNNLIVTGNLTVNGTTTTINATSLAIDDNIIRLAEGNAANIVDIGFVGNYTSGSALHTGLVKQASTSKWLLVSGIAEPTNTINLTGAVYDWLKLGTVEVNTGVAVNGSTSGTTTLVATAVAGTTTLTLPAATDTLVGKATTDTLTNKTLTSPVIATIVNTGTLTLPTSTDTLVGRATTDTLTNKTISGGAVTGATVTVADSAFTIQDNADATKQAKFELASIATATTRTYTLPNLDTVLAGLAVSQTFSNTNVFSNGTNTFGSATTASTIGLASGATSTGNTKIVNIGTSGLTGSTTTITIGATTGAGASTTTMYGTHYIGGATGNESLRVTPTSSAVNCLQITGAITTGAPEISAQGLDPNIDVKVTPKGTGGLSFTGPLLTSGSAGTSGQILTSAGPGVAAVWAANNAHTGTAGNYQFNSIGIGTAASTTAGELRATGTITAFYSDERLKENIKPIENAIQKVMAIQGVTYNANELAGTFGYTDQSEQVGVIAQEVEMVMPQVVKAAPFDIAVDDDNNEISKTGENYKTVQYEKLIPLLIQAIKEQQVQIEELKAQVGK